MYWSFSKKITGESFKKSICTSTSLVVTFDIGLLLRFCVIFILVYDSQSQKQILIRSSLILSIIKTIFFLWVSFICPKHTCKMSFLPFFKALATDSKVDITFISQCILLISYTCSILDLVITIYPPQYKYILEPLVFISIFCLLSWFKDNKFALALDKSNILLLVIDDIKLF